VHCYNLFAAQTMAFLVPTNFLILSVIGISFQGQFEACGGCGCLWAIAISCPLSLWAVQSLSRKPERPPLSFRCFLGIGLCIPLQSIIRVF